MRRLLFSTKKIFKLKTPLQKFQFSYLKDIPDIDKISEPELLQIIHQTCKTHVKSENKRLP